MAANLNQVCDMHSDRFECGDNLVYAASDGTFGLIIHDGGSSFVEIRFGPWCGTKLFSSRNGKRRLDIGGEP
jgi:hypothetical protein